MKPHILLTTDLSDASMSAFPPAVQLARKLEARLTILNVVPALLMVPHGAPTAPAQVVLPNEEQIAAHRERLAELASGIDDVDVATAVEESEHPDRTIVRWAQDHDVGLIFVATHGRSGLRRLVLGSVAEAIVRHAHTPVLVWPSGRESRELFGEQPRILLTTDLSESARRAFAPTAELARRIGAEITCAHVAIDVAGSPHASPAITAHDDASLARAHLAEIRGELGAECAVSTVVLGPGRPDTIIPEHAAAQDFDLIAMSTHGRSGLDRLLLGSTAAAVLRHTETPVLLFPPQ